MVRTEDADIRAKGFDRLGAMAHEHACVLLKQAVLLLLVVRVVAAPVALLPAAADDPSRGGLVVRVCSWPVEQGCPTAAKLTLGERTPSPQSDLPHAGSPGLASPSALRGHEFPALDRYPLGAPTPLRC